MLFLVGRAQERESEVGGDGPYDRQQPAKSGHSNVSSKSGAIHPFFALMPLSTRD